MANNPRNILVIEDNKDVLEAITSILEYSGYQPIGLTRFSEEVFDNLNSEEVSLIILDVMLSGYDGRDLAKRLKNREETREVPIVMISAYPNIEASVREAGADGFIQKPFGIDDLIREIEQYLKKNGTG